MGHLVIEPGFIERSTNYSRRVPEQLNHHERGEVALSPAEHSPLHIVRRSQTRARSPRTPLALVSISGVVCSSAGFGLLLWFLDRFWFFGRFWSVFYCFPLSIMHVVLLCCLSGRPEACVGVLFCC